YIQTAWGGSAFATPHSLALSPWAPLPPRISASPFLVWYCNCSLTASTRWDQKRSGIVEAEPKRCSKLGSFRQNAQPRRPYNSRVVLTKRTQMGLLQVLTGA